MNHVLKGLIMRSIIFSTGIGILLLLSVVITAEAQSILGKHCLDVGPLSLSDPDFCGCTWGEIYFDGDALEGVEVTLAFADQLTTTQTVKVYDDQSAFFSITGAELGAKRGDIMTLTVTVGDQSTSRVFRALPDAEGEQHIPIVVPSTRTMKSFDLSGYMAAVASDEEELLWIGGEAGLLSLDLTTSQTQTYTLPWQTQTVQDIEVASDGVVWVLGEAELAALDGMTWQTYAVPITGTLHDIAIDQQSGDLWIGGGQDQLGAVAHLRSGLWQDTETFPAAVKTIAFSEQNKIWIGTWSKGVYHQTADDSWTHYTTADGLASDYVYDIESNGSSMWIGTRPYLGVGGYLGGLSQYDAAAGSWQTFTTQHGLPLDPTAPDIGGESTLGATDNIYRVASDQSGLMWIGSRAGIYREIQSGVWIPVRDTEMNGPVFDIEFTNGRLAIASADGVSLLSPSAEADNPPTVTSLVVDGGPEISTDGTFIVRATVADENDTDGPIIGWEWSSDLDGPLCTTADICEFETSSLTLGEHMLSVRVQNQLGIWSPLLSEQINVVETNMKYTNLPLVVQGPTSSHVHR